MPSEQYKKAYPDMQDLKDPGYEIFIILISLLSVFNLAIVWIPGIDPDAVNVIQIVNLFLTILFLGDFIYRLFSAESRSHYFFRDWGWADLLASVPSLRILRLFRIFKAYRLLRKYGTRNIVTQLLKHRADSMFYIVIFAVIIVLEAGAFSLLMLERSVADANIQTASDALWWTCVTITTVGYGDRYPITGAGRLVGVFVMAMGVALIGTLAGFIANKLLAPDTTENDECGGEESLGTGAIAEIYKAVRDQGRQNADLQERLDRIERKLEGH